MRDDAYPGRLECLIAVLLADANLPYDATRHQRWLRTAQSMLWPEEALSSPALIQSVEEHPSSGSASESSSSSCASGGKP